MGNTKPEAQPLNLENSKKTDSDVVDNGELRDAELDSAAGGFGSFTSGKRTPRI
ncbi:MAG TPA: hypothetical protein HPP94_16450 [Desulfuromonadales bacterium]|nr:hypothetical protein [Desulfuromonadales bacterium]